MVEIITKYVKEGKIFNRRNVEKVGLEGTDLYDEISDQCEKLVCFYKSKDETYYLYSLVSGKLIAKSPHKIHCINNDYFFIYIGLYDAFLYQIDHDENSKECDLNGVGGKTVFKGITIYSQGTKFISDKFSCDDNLLVEYMNNKKICITNMLTSEKWDWCFSELPDLEYRSIIIRKLEGVPNIFKIRISFKECEEYFNLFDISKGNFLFPKCMSGDVMSSGEIIYDDKLYIITSNKELVDQSGNILIPAFYSNICFSRTLPLVYLDKCGKCGLAKINGEIIFDAIYKEIMETPDKFVVNVCETKEYSKKEVKK